MASVGFNKPAFVGLELEEIRKAILTNKHISGMGPYTQQCEEHFESWYRTPVLLVTSCTHALEMAAQLLNLEPEDEVILPSYTFVSTANAFALRGCKLLFADCDEAGQLSLDHLETLLTEKTRAVCVVHYAGHSTNMEQLTEFCKTHKVALIEDAAQAIGVTYKGKLLGTWGDLGCLSFHETKNITAGEGGALIINKPELLDRARHIREKGTNRAQFIQGLVDKYTWVDIGSSYVLSEINAAYLWVQLQNFEQIQARRAEIWERYAQTLQPYLTKLDACFLPIPSFNTTNYHLFGLVFRQSETRDRFINFMRTQNIMTPFHYVSLHNSPMGHRLNIEEPQLLPQTDRLSKCLVRLPIFYNMTDSEQDRVIAAIQQFSHLLQPVIEAV